MRSPAVLRAGVSGLFLLLILPAVRAQEPVLLRTFAGTGAQNFSGDGGPAAEATLSRPMDVTVDSAGRVYLSDSYNGRIRRVGPDGVISTVAGGGSGAIAASTTAVPATSVDLGYVYSLCVDRADDVYVVAFPPDARGALVLKLDADSGTLARIAGGGTLQYVGSVGGYLGAIIIDNFVRPRRIFEFQSEWALEVVDDPPAHAAEVQLSRAVDLDVDSQGNVYLLDDEDGGRMVFRIDGAGIIVRHAGGGGSFEDAGPARNAALVGATSIALDAADRLYIAEYRKIRQVPSLSQDISLAVESSLPTFPSDPSGIEDWIWPQSIAVDREGNLILSDILSCVYRVELAARRTTRVAGVPFRFGFNGDDLPADTAFLFAPLGAAVDGSGNLLIADWLNNRVRATFEGCGHHEHTEFIDTVIAGDLDLTASSPAQSTARPRYELTASGTGLVSETTPVTACIPNARFPLGTTFHFTLNRRTSAGVGPVPCRFSLDEARRAPVDAVKELRFPLLERPALFPNLVAFLYDPARAEATKAFQAVHLGTVRLTLEPEDATIRQELQESIGHPSIELLVEILAPEALGTTHNELDVTVWIPLADLRGVPPHFLKAQVGHESAFDPRTYRYEPITREYNQIYLRDVRKDFPYVLYLLASEKDARWEAQPQGALLLDPADYDIRSKYYKIIRPDPATGKSVRRSILNSDQHVSLAELWKANAGFQNWDSLKLYPSQARIIANLNSDPSLTLIQFTAQTPISGSYGLLQVCYSDIQEEFHWLDRFGRGNPSILFDSEENWEVGGGSLVLGTHLLLSRFERSNGKLNQQAPALASYGDFKEAFVRAYTGYNGLRAYGLGVVSEAAAYQPKALTPIYR